MKKIGVFLMVAGLAMLGACGGSSSGDGGTTTSTYSVQTSVATPLSASVSVPMKGAVLKTITEEATPGALVQAQDAAGANLGECTTGDDGTCNIPLTGAQLQAGVVFVAANMHSFREYNATDCAAADAGTQLTAPVNAEEDMVYALGAYNCGGAFSSCPPTVDIECMRAMVEVLPGDGTPGTSTIDGYMEGLLVAQANAIINGADAAGALIAALGGDPTAYGAAVGSETVPGSSVPVADAVSNSAIGAGAVSAAYCTRPAAGEQSPREEAQEHIEAGGVAIFNRAIVGPFEFLTPAEIQAGVYGVDGFQGYMNGLMQLEGGIATMGDPANSMARRAMANGFRQGMFADPTNAHVAVGLINATFPAPVGGVWDWTGNAYDPSSAAIAGRNALIEMTSASGFDPANYTPGMIYGAFQPALGDPTRRTTFVNGGVSGFVGAFMGDPGNFVPTDNFGQIKAPPGGSCASSADCLPCDRCVSSVCTQGSSYMGTTCTSDSDCDEVTLCVGPPQTQFSAFSGRNCMCASGVPTGMGIYSADSSQQYGMEGGYTPPTDGGQAGYCGPGVPCTGALSCTDLDYGGVCTSGDFKFPYGMPCTANANCFSNSCVSNLCALGAGEGGAKADGQTCAAPSECQSWNCVGGICVTSGGGGELKPDGVACTTDSECASGYCKPDNLTCGQPGGGLPTGSPCTYPDQCASHVCDYGTNMCL